MSSIFKIVVIWLIICQRCMLEKQILFSFASATYVYNVAGDIPKQCPHLVQRLR